MILRLTGLITATLSKRTAVDPGCFFGGAPRQLGSRGGCWKPREATYQPSARADNTRFLVFDGGYVRSCSVVYATRPLSPRLFKVISRWIDRYSTPDAVTGAYETRRDEMRCLGWGLGWGWGWGWDEMGNEIMKCFNAAHRRANQMELTTSISHHFPIICSVGGTSSPVRGAWKGPLECFCASGGGSGEQLVR